MTWFYELNGEQHGPVSESALDQLLIQGRVRPTTRVWKEGMTDWELVSQVRTLEPEQPDMADATPPPLPADWQAEERIGPPWEHQREIGFIPALAKTVAGALFDPYKLFTEMRRQGSLAAPLVFALITATIGYIVGFLLWTREPLVLPTHIQPQIADAVRFIRTPAGIRQCCLLAPFLVVLVTFVNSAVLHVLLQLFRATREPFATTFRVFCYAFGSTRVLHLIPMVGPMVAFFWNITITAIGLARAHQINPMLATLLTGLGLFCTGVVFVMIATALMLAGGGVPG